MTNNIFRILLSRTLFHVAMKEEEKIEREIKKKKESEEEFSNMSLHELREATFNRGEDRKWFCVRPIMAGVYEKNLFMVCKIGIVFVVAYTLFAFAAVIYLNFFDDTVYYPDAMGNIGSSNYIYSIITCIPLVWLLQGILVVIYKYMENTSYIFGQVRIRIKRLWKKEKVLTYEELSKGIEKKKIIVHNGRFEFPYDGGRIPVYTWGDEPTPPEFYRFINKQCGTSIPEVKKIDNVTVRKTGIGWTFYSFLGIPMICIGMAFGFVGSISEFGIKLGNEFWEYYINYLLSPANIFGLLGFGCTVIGFGLKLFYYFPARKHFKHYKDIKVSLF